MDDPVRIISPELHDAYNEMDFNLKLGMALTMSSYAGYFDDKEFGSVVRYHLIPPLDAGQWLFVCDQEFVVRAMVTWALLDSETFEDIRETKRPMELDEWNTGDIMFFDNVIGPNGWAL